MREPASKSKVKEAKEIAEVIRALSGLVEGGNSVPSTHVGYLTNACNSSSIRPDTLFSPPWAPSQYTHTFKKVEIKKDTQN